MNSLFSDIAEKLAKQGLKVVSKDFDRPWGGFFVVDEKQAQEFANIYFDGLDVSGLRLAGKLSPKIILVKPEARLSWQYHNRRKETWRVVDGPVGITRSLTDEQGSVQVFQSNQTVVMDIGERHRLIGLKNWGVVAEFWQHTDPEHPSDEDDIVRIHDDYDRSTPT
ncbi:MAG TPA: phosphoheptose isomerase [Cryomorphaceae bacterium]|nr:phosphoheptose isomerase [Cryomorphaceae bacterium]|tara:strand:+ start:4919 stop:5416 length:498 start_codon:yes stop_codon:yes gene_type:complete